MVKTININWRKNGLVAVTTQRLTEAQYIAYQKLDSEKWKNGAELEVSQRVLDKLVLMRLVEKKFVYGYMRNPLTMYDYRKTGLIDEDK